MKRSLNVAKMNNVHYLNLGQNLGQLLPAKPRLLLKLRDVRLLLLNQRPQLSGRLASGHLVGRHLAALGILINLQIMFPQHFLKRLNHISEMLL